MHLSRSGFRAGEYEVARLIRQHAVGPRSHDQFLFSSRAGSTLCLVTEKSVQSGLSENV